MNGNPTRRTALALLAGGGAALVARTGREPSTRLRSETGPEPGRETGPELATVEPPPEPDWAAIEHACREAIAASRGRDRRAVPDTLAVFDEFFAGIRPRVGPMLDDLFDLGSTAKILWYSGRDWLGTDDRAERYVAQFLAAYLHLPDGLDQAFAEFERSLAYRLNANEQELAMSLEVELAPLADRLDLRGRSGWSPRVGGERRLGIDLEAAAVGQGLVGVGLLALDPGRYVLDGLKVVGKRLLSGLTPRLLASLGLKAGGRAVSGTVLATGAAASWWSAGLSLLVSIVITMLIESLINKAARARVGDHLIRGLELVRCELHETLGAEARRLVDDLHDRRLAQVHELLAKARSAGKEMP